MSELLAVEGCTLDFQDPTHSGTITILPASVKYLKVKCNGNQVYTTITFSVTNFSGGAVPSGGTGGGSITGSTTKAKVNSGVQPVRENDDVTIVITGTGSPPPTQNTTVYVKTAGQTKAKGI